MVIPLVCFYFFEIGRNYMSIIITIVSNTNVLVSHNIICFGFFMSMSHAVNKKTPLSVFSYLPPPARFSLGLRFVLQEILYQPFFVVIRFFTKDNVFADHSLLGGFDFAILFIICVFTAFFLLISFREFKERII